MINKFYENREKRIDFYITDFTDTSAKLESLDRRIQFSVQLYAMIVGGAITIILALFDNSIKDIHSDNNFFYFYVFIAFFIISIFGQALFFYNVSGLNSHNIFLNKMNNIRRIVLCELGFTIDQCDKYDFTQCVIPKHSGMSFYMVIAILVFYSISSVIACFPAYFFLTTISCMNFKLSTFALVFFLIFILIPIFFDLHYLCVSNERTKIACENSYKKPMRIY